MNSNAQPRMPAIFFGHGSPMNALESNRHTDAWRRLGASLPRPRAILMISAHWYLPGTQVTAMAQPRTIHDFGNFPRALFEVQYPAPGAPDLAARVRDLLAPTDVVLDQSWGLDHGAWSVLVHAWPQADVPVVQLSMDTRLTPAQHYALAQKLAPLRDAGVLIAASGNVVHNLRVIRFQNDAPAYDWALRFETRVRELVAAGNHEALMRCTDLGDDARFSIPTPEHYLPLLYVLAQQRSGEALSFPSEGIELSSISMLSVAVGLA